MVRESAVSADETTMKRMNCAASPAPRKAASAAASAPTPNQSSTKPGVKTSAMTSTTPSTVHRIHVQFSPIAALAFEEVLHHEPDVGGALGEPAHEVRVPRLPVRHVDPHVVALSRQALLQVAPHAV